MRCIDPNLRVQRLARPLAALLALAITGCALRPPPRPAPAPAPAPAPVPAAEVARVVPPPPPAARVEPAPPARVPAPVATARLAPPAAARSWDEFKLQAARRLVAANPAGTYIGPVPEPLLAIPVLEVELNADGSVRRVEVLRHPSQARDTTQLAIDAVHRAAPYGEMRRLPQPWKWSEAFLFDDDRRFKPRMLDQ